MCADFMTPRLEELVLLIGVCLWLAQCCVLDAGGPVVGNTVGGLVGAGRLDVLHAQCHDVTLSPDEVMPVSAAREQGCKAVSDVVHIIVSFRPQCSVHSTA